MTLSLRLQATLCKAESQVCEEALTHLSNNGYEPLVREAKRKFIGVFGGSEADVSAPWDAYPDALYKYPYRRLALTRYNREYGIPVAGDIFFIKEGTGVLFLTLQVPGAAFARRSPEQETESEPRLLAGFIGEDADANGLEPFIDIVSEALKNQDAEPNWQPVQTRSPQFRELCSSEDTKFVLASSLPQQELELSGILEDLWIRNLAVTIRRAGAILIDDLARRAEIGPDEVQAAIERLQKGGLLSQEYVVICTKTSNQVNRVNSRQQIEQMGKIGVRCSCGNLISEERIEKLIVPTSTLQKMLDQSYWMTARLVYLLGDLQVPQDRVLLNLQEGPEEIDAFVDLDGSLVMFELKDSLFSMGHAYPFSGRIGLYKPDVAVIVSTRGIAPEVKEYFKQIEPEASLVYVGSLGDLGSRLGEIVAQVRWQTAQELIAQFDPMANIGISLAEVLAPRLGIGQ